MDTSAAPSAGILSGLRVLELGQVRAGPFGGVIFADLGAEVLKIERVDGSDEGRRMGVRSTTAIPSIFRCSTVASARSGST